MEKHYCPEHLELHHAIFGDGKENIGLIADYKNWKEYTTGIINKVLGGACVCGVLWAVVQVILMVHGKIM